MDDTTAGPRRLTTGVALAALCLYVLISVGVERLEWAAGGLSPILLLPIAFLAYPLVGTLIIARRGSHAIGWILLAMGPNILLNIASEDYALYALVQHPGSLPFGNAAVVFSQTYWVVSVMLFAVLLPLLFPTGRLLSPRWRFVIVAAVGYVVLVLAGNAFMPGSVDSQHPELKNPIGIPGHNDLFGALATLSLIPGIGALGGAIASLVVRYRRSTGPEREQLKWFLFSVLLIPVPLALNGAGPVGQISFTVVVPLVSISIGVAVLRYRLYGIDVVISRTLVYGALAVFITAVYVGIVVGIGTLIGQGNRPNLALSIVATALVAVGFQPVRERLQKVANRIVYGTRATPYEVLSEFSERVAESYAADDVLPRMARVLAEGTGAEQAAVWLRSDGELRTAATWPPSATPPPAVRGEAGWGEMLPQLPETDRAVPVRHQGELLGALSVSKRRGESLTPIEEKLLDDLAHQAGLVLKNVGLTADLQARLDDLRESRKRLVAAQDQERRRLERNLHDGAQQHLVALKVKLGLAEMLAAKDPEKAKATIAELKSDADEALETLRDLARGIYPPLLADKGLVAALEAQARKATLPVTVEAEDIGRYPQEVEAAVYFCVLEALQNVQKYANATRATVRLVEGPPPNLPPRSRGRSPNLTFVVEDDGTGFDPATTRRGSGLNNIADRLDALGGSITLQSAQGAGTALSATLPTGLVEAVP